MSIDSLKLAQKRVDVYNKACAEADEDVAVFLENMGKYKIRELPAALETLSYKIRHASSLKNNLISAKDAYMEIRLAKLERQCQAVSQPN